jgi:hypothetical protein
MSTNSRGRRAHDHRRRGAHDFQPQEHVRFYLDPAGHTFCLFVNE